MPEFEAEIDALHRLLQAWFRAEGPADPAPILERFDDGFTMVTPAAKLITFEQFAAALPTMRGTRPTLVMVISDIVTRRREPGAALLTYRERQIQDTGATDRLSTVLLLERPGRATPVWRHLHETLQA